MLGKAGRGPIYRRAERGIGAPPATPGRCARRRTASVRGEKATGFTRELWTDGDEHMVTRMATSIVRTALLPWPDRARARCSELRRRRVPGGCCRGQDKDGGAAWQALAGAEASTRETERTAASRARQQADWHGAHAWSPRELCLLANLVPKIMSGVLFMVDMRVTQV